MVPFKKTLVLSIICNKCKNEDEKLFTEEKPIEIIKVLGFNRKQIITFRIWLKNTSVKYSD